MNLIGLSIETLFTLFDISLVLLFLTKTRSKCSRFTHRCIGTDCHPFKSDTELCLTTEYINLIHT